MRNIRVALVLMALGLPMDVLAQPLGPPAAQPFRKWDIGGGLGIRFGETADVVIPIGSWSADLGRYWTPHIRTSVAIMTTRQSRYRDYNYLPQASTTIYAEDVTHPAGCAASIAYQFFENQFVHPYVSAGARFASTYSNTITYSTRPPYQQVITSTQSHVEARPEIGGGFKSYFGNGRAFMRTELLMAVNPHGSPHAILTVGAGVDF